MATKKQSKEYVLMGYVDDIHALSVTLRTNSIKQARQRFLRKYEAVLVGEWEVLILQDSKEMDRFSIDNIVSSVINKTVNDSLLNVFGYIPDI